MKNLQEIKKEKENRYNQISDACGLFWAFSDSQFLENKTPLEEGDKYVSIGAGGYMPKSKVKIWLDGTDEIEKWFKAEIKASKGARRALIAYELANHEAYYTCSISDTLAALPEGYTKKEVWKVYFEESQKAA
jgi:hypothetical protein